MKNRFWKELGMLVLGTTISLVLTFGTAKIIDNVHRSQDRRLSALMVMSHIESFAQKLDILHEKLCEADSAAAWLLDHPIEEIEKLPDEELLAIMNKAFVRSSLNHDKTTENIFSDNIDTWKNMGNFQFIDKVGQCFSVIHFCEEDWDQTIKDMTTTAKEVSKRMKENPDGKSFCVWLLKDPTVRTQLQGLHNTRNWINETKEHLRYDNRLNMAAIGISEQEVLDFLKEREKEIKADVEVPDLDSLLVPRLDGTQLPTYRRYDSILDASNKK